MFQNLFPCSENEQMNDRRTIVGHLLVVIASLIVAVMFSLDFFNSNNCVETKGDELMVYEKRGKYGYKNSQGVVVIKPKYDAAENFSEGLAAVEKDGLMGFINSSGDVVVPFEYDLPQGFEGDLIHDYHFSEGFAEILWSFPVYGDVSTRMGNLQIVVNTAFFEGYAVVEKDGKFGFINTLGQVVVPLEYDVARPFTYGLAAVGKDGCGMGFIDTCGEVVVPLEYDDVCYFINSIAVVEKEGKYGAVNNVGSIVLPVEYEDVIPAESALIFGKAGEYVIINLE